MAQGKWSEVEARGVLEAWKRSGLPLERFAKQRGIVSQRLRWWRHKFRRQEMALAESTPAILPVRVAAEPGTCVHDCTTSPSSANPRDVGRRTPAGPAGPAGPDVPGSPHANVRRPRTPRRQDDEAMTRCIRRAFYRGDERGPRLRARRRSESRRARAPARPVWDRVRRRGGGLLEARGQGRDFSGRGRARRRRRMRSTSGGARPRSSTSHRS